MPLAIDLPSFGQLVGAATVIGALAALLQVWTATRSERRRTQPVVIAHAYGGRRFSGGPA